MTTVARQKFIMPVAGAPCRVFRPGDRLDADAVAFAKAAGVSIAGDDSASAMPAVDAADEPGATEAAGAPAPESRSDLRRRLKAAAEILVS